MRPLQCAATPRNLRSAEMRMARSAGAILLYFLLYFLLPPAVSYRRPHPLDLVS